MKTAAKFAVAGIFVGIATSAPAQLLGGRVGVGAGVSVPSVGATVDGAARTTGDAVRSTVDAAPSVTVRAGASTRVDRGTRCYYQPDDYYYDPVYRDGYYYCEQRNSGAGVGVSAGVRR